jgi:hypothetical protein
MLQLTAKEIGLLLKVSTMDISHEYSGGPDTSWEVCPLCRGAIGEDDLVSEYMTQKEFDRDILPSLSDLGEEEEYNHYPEIVVYQLNSEQQKKIPFPHKEGCEIEALRALHKKMKDFQNKESSE